MASVNMPSLMTVAIVLLLGCIVATLAILATLSHGAGLMMLISKLFPATRQSIFREEREGRAQGFSPYEPLEGLLGQVGVLTTDAHPVGKARFGSDIVTVISDDGFLAAGGRVCATALRSGLLVVRPS